MSFLQKVGIVFKFWDFKRAPAITAIVLFFWALVGLGIGYGVWTLFAE